jgi:hypothetical protein
MNTKPTFPITVTFNENNDVWTFNDEKEAACTLEWFDSESPDEMATVVDSKGQLVSLKVEKLNILICELK